MIRRLSAVCVATLLTLACASSTSNPNAPGNQRMDTDDLEPGRYSARPGETPVGAIPSAMLRDNERGKDIEVNIDYPMSAGPHPIIIWSHGYGSSNRAYVALSAHWASHGYIVMKPNHADAGKLMRTNVAEVWTPEEWRNRARDISFLIDSLPKLEAEYPELKGKFDTARIGVGGHSYGAHTALLLGGARTFPGDASFADPRVKAVVVMAPPGTGEVRGLTNDSWKTLTAPTLFLTGSRDFGTNESENAEWRKQAFEQTAAGDKWFVLIAGAGHGTYTGRIGGIVDQQQRAARQPGERDPIWRPQYPGTGSEMDIDAPPLRAGMASGEGLNERRRIARVRMIPLAFFDAYVRGESAGRERLDTLATGVGVEVTKR